MKKNIRTNKTINTIMLASILFSTLMPTYAQADNNISEITQEILSEEKTPQQGNGQTTPWKVYVDGVQTNVVPILYKNANYLPIRATGNSLNAEVDWNGENKVAIVEKDTTRLELPQAHNKGVVINTESDNEEAKQLSTTDASLSVININSSTYLPLRFIGEQLGYTITVDVNTKSAYFNSPGYTPAETPQTPQTSTTAPTYYDSFGNVIENKYNLVVPDTYKGCEIAYIEAVNGLIENERFVEESNLTTLQDKIKKAQYIASFEPTFCPNPGQTPDDFYDDIIEKWLSEIKYYESVRQSEYTKKAYELATDNSESRARQPRGDYYMQPYSEKFGLPASQNYSWFWVGGGWSVCTIK